MPNTGGVTLVSDNAQVGADVIKTGNIKDAEIVNADISATANIAKTKVPDAATKGANTDITSLGGLTTPLSVPQGGTGLAAPDDHFVLIGSGAGAITPITPGAAGGVLASNGVGADPSFQTLGGMSLLASATYSAATQDTCTADDGTDFITSTSPHGLVDGDSVYFTTDNTIPAGLSANTRYFVRDSTPTTFKVSATPYDTRIDITNTGVGTLTWHNGNAAIVLSVAARNHLHIVISSKVPSGASNVNMVFNTDGAANYGCAITKDGGAIDKRDTRKMIVLSGESAAYEQLINIELLNIAAYRKIANLLGIQPWANATCGGLFSGGFHWNNTTDQITKITVYLDTNRYLGVGSTVYVYGTD